LQYSVAKVFPGMSPVLITGAALIFTTFFVFQIMPPHSSPVKAHDSERKESSEESRVDQFTPFSTEVQA